MSRRFPFMPEQKPLSENWKTLSREDGKSEMECQFQTEKGSFFILCPCRKDYNRENPRILCVSLDGDCRIPDNRTQPWFLHDYFPLYGIPFELQSGRHILQITFQTPDGSVPESETQFIYLIPAREKPKSLPKHQTFYTVLREETLPPPASPFDSNGWTPGVGRHITPGRFGFSKGDGLLDCAMPALGIIDKMYLCGNPRYTRNFRWNYSVLPEGVRVHSSLPPSDVGVEEDRIRINHLSVNWSAGGEKKHFECTYSLASPAILTESDAECMRLSNLNFAGNYQYVMIPRKQDRLEVVTLEQANLSDMAENWVLFFGCTEFPDIPLMVVFERNPEMFQIRRSLDGRLQEMLFGKCSWILTATPFGIESFDPGETLRETWIQDAARRCRFWSRSFLAYPVRCVEYFRLDREAEKVSIEQVFSYRYLHDAWGTKPLELAPLPPVAVLSGIAEYETMTDFHFPGKYGPLKGRIGNHSGYTLPWMPMERRFPLREAGSPIPEILSEGLETYRSFSGKFASTLVSYPYAGALLEPFAPASTMQFFFPPSIRDYLQNTLQERMILALTPGRTALYPVIQFRRFYEERPNEEGVIRLYEESGLRHMKLWNWYDRIEPFTGFHFKICYLNLYNLFNGTIQTGTPAEIRSLKIPLIENDWGVGLTFTYLYEAALAAGSFEPIRKNWNLIKEIYAFFDGMHDWACMGTGYSDNGLIWVEGANWGLFPAFVHMARAAGDVEAENFGIYNAAKQLALRLAIFRSGESYFPKYFRTSPWYCVKAFYEECRPEIDFQKVPTSPGEAALNAYNMTTEGLYPEFYETMLRFGGESFRNAMKRIRDEIRNRGKQHFSDWVHQEIINGHLILETLDPNCSPQQVASDIDRADRDGLLIKEWRGIHIFSRYLPRNYFRCQLLAWLEMRRHPIWLETWTDLRILRAEWNGQNAEIEFSGTPPMTLQCGIRTPPRRVILNGQDLPFEIIQPHQLRLSLFEPGLLIIEFCLDTKKTKNTEEPENERQMGKPAREKE